MAMDEPAAESNPEPSNEPSTLEKDATTVSTIITESNPEGAETETDSAMAEATTLSTTETVGEPEVPLEPEAELTESEKIHLRLRENPYDTEAWQQLILEAEESGNLDSIRAAYDALLKQYPNAPSAQLRYITHFLNNQRTFAEAEALFKRFLKVTSPSVNMYRYYLTYIRRINAGTDTQSRETIRKSYEFTINSIGSDKDSGDIWCDYIAFINSGENSSTWEEQQKMDMVRKAYQRAVQTPLDNVEKLWSDYESFEVKLNRITAKKFMSELSPAYMQARSVGRDLTKHVSALYPPEAPLPANAKPDLVLPVVPTFSIAERQLVGKWKAYLKWEESNPLMIEEKDKKDLHNRIQLVYRKALVRMRFYPEIWFMAYNWTHGVGKHDEALYLLKAGLEANSSSFLLTFAYAEALEVRKDYAQVHMTYSDFLEVQRKLLEGLVTRVDLSKEKKTPELGDTDDSIVEPDPPADTALAALGDDFEDRKKEYALTYIMYMRFARRAEGVKASRSLFGKARRDKFASWEVYEAGALMEYHTTQDKEVATRIFEAGMGQHAKEKEFVLRYLTFLISVNDENNARALFERVIPTFNPEESRPIWERWARYEHQYGDLEASQKIDKRMAEIYPNDPPIKRFAQRHIYLGLDAIASRDIGARVKKETNARGAESLTSISSSNDRSSSSGSLLKRQPSPEHEKRRGDHGGHKRQRNASPARDRERDRWDGPSRRRSPGPPEKDRSFNNRRIEKEREDEKPVVLPQALSWFIGQLPPPSTFDECSDSQYDETKITPTASISWTAPAGLQSVPGPQFEYHRPKKISVITLLCLGLRLKLCYDRTVMRTVAELSLSCSDIRSISYIVLDELDSYRMLVSCSAAPTEVYLWACITNINIHGPVTGRCLVSSDPYSVEGPQSPPSSPPSPAGSFMSKDSYATPFSFPGIDNIPVAKPAPLPPSPLPSQSLRKSISVDSFVHYGRDTLSPVVTRPNRGHTGSALEPPSGLVGLRRDLNHVNQSARSRGDSIGSVKSFLAEDLDADRSGNYNSSSDRYKHASLKSPDPVRSFVADGELPLPSRTPTLSTTSSMSSIMSSSTSSSTQEAASDLRSASLQQVPLALSSGRTRSGSVGVYTQTRRIHINTQIASEQNQAITIAVVGTAGCGKSVAIRKGLKNHNLSEPSGPLPGAHPTIRHTRRTGRYTKEEGIECPLHVIEVDVTAEMMQSPISPLDYLPEALKVDGVVVCYDASDEASFRPVEDLLRAYWELKLSMIVIACKSDMEGQVDPGLASEILSQYGAGLVEVNYSESGRGKIKKSFQFLLQVILKERRNGSGRTRFSEDYRNPTSPTLMTTSPSWDRLDGSRTATPTASSASSPNHVPLPGPIVVQTSLPTIPASRSTSVPNSPTRARSTDDLLCEARTRYYDQENQGAVDTMVCASAHETSPSDVRTSSTTELAPPTKTENKDKEMRSAQWATLDELLDKLLFLSVSGDDPTFITHFLLTYRRFASPRNLLLAMQKRMRQLDNPSGDPMFACFAQMKCVGVILSRENESHGSPYRICHLLEVWIQDYKYDFAVRGTAGALSALIKSIISKTYLLHYGSDFLPLLEVLPTLVDQDSAWALKADDPADDSDDSYSLIDDDDESVKSVTKVSPPTDEASVSTNLPSRSRKPSLPLLTTKALFPSSGSSNGSAESDNMEFTTKQQLRELVKLANEVNMIDSGEIAQEITRIEKRLFLEIEDPDANTIVRFNNVSSHLADWVVSLILCHDRPRDRARQIEKFVEVAHKLRVLNNYSALRAFVAGINNSTFAGDQTMEKFKQRSPEQAKALQSWDVLLQAMRAHRAYRMALRNTKGACIPALEVHMSDLIRAHEANDDVKAGDSTKIHWGKFNMMGRFITSTTQCQAQCRATTDYDFPERAHIHLLLRTKYVMDVEMQKSRIAPPDDFNDPSLGGVAPPVFNPQTNPQRDMRQIFHFFRFFFHRTTMSEYVMTIDSDAEDSMDGHSPHKSTQEDSLNPEFIFDFSGDPYNDLLEAQSAPDILKGTKPAPISVDDIIARRQAAKRKREYEPESDEDSSDDSSDGEEGLDEFNEMDGDGMDEEDPLATSDETEGEEADTIDENASESDAEDDSEPETQAEMERKTAFFDSEVGPSAVHDSFLTMNISRPIIKSLTTLGFHHPTPIQAATIPIALLGKDIVGGAQTGSGKTAAFIIPMLERLLYREKGKKAAATRCLVLVPTRELAVQCYDVGTKLGTHTDITFCVVVVRARMLTLLQGGLSIKSQEAALRNRPDVVIATPGRLIDHIHNSPSFTLETLDIVVLDEADRMLSDGFADELAEIVKSCPKSRQTMLFSATMTDSVDELVKMSLNKPVRLFVDPQKSVARNLTQEFVRIRAAKESERSAMLAALCKRTFKSNAIVFFRSKKLAHQMRIVFSLLGMKCSELHGDLTQEQRLKALQEFRDGVVDYLMATDLAARGLDIKGVETVINYDMPGQLAQYLHRVGRTARAGNKGRSVTLVGEADRKMLKAAIKHGSDKDKIRHRIVPQDAVSKWTGKLEGLKEEISEVLREEKEEKQLRQAEMELKKGQNLIEHEAEIFSRPARTWFQTEQKKKVAEGISKTQYEAGFGAPSAKGKQKASIQEAKPKRDKFSGLTRKAKRRKLAKDEDAELGNESTTRAAVRSAKKSMRPSKIGEPERRLGKTSKEKKKKARGKLGKKGGFERDLGVQNRHEGARAKKSDTVGGMNKKKGPKRKAK
ncbi:hypothetical protein D9757_002906 [Collybiopsis confluens]|uniref:mRNA 3'-end-processing protein RNA14 n=1 Tax=Collybiopsis confluens TaxID=2823264 RepID=A0A8H5HVK2_9AGAR|nr:hypothetical protein D9757_002906 [Collybiopsis confluens]